MIYILHMIVNIQSAFVYHLHSLISCSFPSVGSRYYTFLMCHNPMFNARTDLTLFWIDVVPSGCTWSCTVPYLIHKDCLGFQRDVWMCPLQSNNWTNVTTFLLPRDLAADLLQMIPDNQVLLAKLCAFYPGSSSEIDQIHQKVGAEIQRKFSIEHPF